MCLVIFHGIKGIQRMNSTRREVVESLRNRLLQVGCIKNKYRAYRACGRYIMIYIYISTHISKVFKVSDRYIHSYRCINQFLANGTMIGSRKGKNSIPCHAVPHWRDHGSRGELIIFGGAVGVLFMGRTIGF